MEEPAMKLGVSRREARLQRRRQRDKALRNRRRQEFDELRGRIQKLQHEQQLLVAELRRVDPQHALVEAVDKAVNSAQNRVTVYNVRAVPLPGVSDSSTCPRIGRRGAGSSIRSAALQDMTKPAASLLGHFSSPPAKMTEFSLSCSSPAETVGIPVTCTTPALGIPLPSVQTSSLQATGSSLVVDATVPATRREVCIQQYSDSFQTGVPSKEVTETEFPRLGYVLVAESQGLAQRDVSPPHGCPTPSPAEVQHKASSKLFSPSALGGTARWLKLADGRLAAAPTHCLGQQQSVLQGQLYSRNGCDVQEQTDMLEQYSGQKLYSGKADVYRGQCQVYQEENVVALESFRYGGGVSLRDHFSPVTAVSQWEPLQQHSFAAFHNAFTCISEHASAPLAGYRL